MSLTAGLFASVSAVTANSNRISGISDNIANLNTTGYKSSGITFTTLVTGSSLGIGGGVIASNRPLVSEQGLIQSTQISTDIAIQGDGFIVVRDDPDADIGEVRYTRAGSFRQDSEGNFVNAAGFFLQAYPLDSEGRLPGEEGNLDTTSNALLESLQTVNTDTISGIAFATTAIELGVNLDASENAVPGAGDIADLSGAAGAGVPNNATVAATDIIVPDNFDENTLALVIADGTDTDFPNAFAGASPASTFTISTSTDSQTFEYGGFEISADLTGVTIADQGGGAAVVLPGVSPETQSLAAAFTEGQEVFTITSASLGTITYTYSTSPSTNGGEFDTLADLVDAINATAGVNARIEGNRLYIASDDPTEAVTFANATGTPSFVADLGIDDNIAAEGATPRFNSISTLEFQLTNNIDNFSATVANAEGDATINIFADDPTETVNFTDNAAALNGGTGTVNSTLAYLGLDGTTAFQPTYEAGVTDIAGGNVTADFTRSIQVFDSLGEGHNLFVSFVKLQDNTWAGEVYAADPLEVDSDSDGRLASGTITFNGDGSLADVSVGLTDPFEVNWTNGAEDSSISLELGTAGAPVGTANATNFGLTDGLSQFAGNYNVRFADQNGASSGLLTDIEIAEDGTVIANFSNGESRDVFQIPLASFPNPDGLTQINGNAYVQSDDSGSFTLNTTDASGVGQFVVGALEAANVELTDELTRIIVAQRNYEAATQIISTVDELLEDLTQVLR